MTQPTAPDLQPGVWDTAAVIAWLATLGIGAGLDVDIPVVDPEDAAVKTWPAGLVTVTLLPGLGLSFEGAFDRPAFQLLTRGAARRFVRTERTALAIDQRITFADFPTTTPVGLRLLRVQRSGGRPAAIGPQGGDQRTPFAATYIAEVSTGPVPA